MIGERDLNSFPSLDIAIPQTTVAVWEIAPRPSFCACAVRSVNGRLTVYPSDGMLTKFDAQTGLISQDFMSSQNAPTGSSGSSTPQPSAPPSFEVTSPGIAQANWCFVKDNDKKFSQKAMNNGTCLADLTQYPYVAVITEHQIAAIAARLACAPGSVEGIPIEFGSLEAIRICNCHNVEAQSLIFLNADRVLSFLKSKGGCAG